MKSGGSDSLTYSSIPRLGNASALYPSKAARPSEVRKKATAGGRTKEKTGSLFYTVICTGQIFLKLHFSSSNVFGKSRHRELMAQEGWEVVTLGSAPKGGYWCKAHVLTLLWPPTACWLIETESK